MILDSDASFGAKILGDFGFFFVALISMFLGHWLALLISRVKKLSWKHVALTPLIPWTITVVLFYVAGIFDYNNDIAMRISLVFGICMLVIHAVVYFVLVVKFYQQRLAKSFLIYLLSGILALVFLYTIQWARGVLGY